MNKQETFDYVVMHLYRQGKPALSSNGHCDYRTDDGLMCAVGCLIPDSVYKVDMEGYRVGRIVKDFILPDYIKNNVKMLRSLQNVHDGWASALKFNNGYSFSQIEDKLKQVAESFSVQYNAPEQ